MLNKNFKKRRRHSLLIGVILSLSLLILAACGQEEEANEEEEVYTMEDFLADSQPINEGLNQTLDHYQNLLNDYPVEEFIFGDEQIESKNTVTQILNNFDPGTTAEHTQVNDQEEYLFYEFSSTEEENEDKSQSSFIGLYFINGGLSQAGIFTGQVEASEEQMHDYQTAQEVTSIDQSLSTLGGQETTLMALSTMNFDGENYHLLAFPSQGQSGGQMVQLSIYDGSNQVASSSAISSAQYSANSINNTMMNQMINYYTTDILGLEDENQSSNANGSLMPYDEFLTKTEEVTQLVKVSSLDDPIKISQVQDILGEPRNQTASTMDYQAQNEAGDVETYTVVFEEEDVTTLSYIRQSAEDSFPFDQAAIQELGQMDVTTPIETIEERFGPADLKEYNVETEDTVYMWMSGDDQAEINLVQVVVGADGNIAGIAFDGNQDSE